ncbi:hypothetical protein [Ureaplasma diversum]|uniref:Transmembrane protein n=1 Tax=Ureaplasma diversum NCTC 246 TaxID=1188241 RepID=A0A084EXL0_9BACT|nr:hypothetical protein [Ureaplasma diversum]KEZ22702.1 Hypothetical protein, predicted transmembrane protein [Ureaplasma diversum NCTC 246]
MINISFFNSGSRAYSQIEWDQRLKSKQFKYTLLSGAIGAFVFLIFCLITTFVMNKFAIVHNYTVLNLKTLDLSVGLYAAVGIASLLLFVFSIVLIFFRNIPKLATTIAFYIIDSICLSIIIGFVSLFVGYQSLLTAIGLSALVYVLLAITGFFISQKATRILRLIYIILSVAFLIVFLIVIILSFTAFRNSQGVLVAQLIISIIMLLVISISVVININNIKKQEIVADQKALAQLVAWNGFILYHSYSRLLYYLLYFFIKIKRIV